MGEEITNGYGTQQVHCMPISVGVADEHTDAAERRQKLRHGIEDLEAAFLVQRHQRRADDGLRHRIDAKDRVCSHGRARIAILPANLCTMHHLTTPRQQRTYAGKPALIDIPLHRWWDAVEALGTESNGFGGLDGGRHGTSPRVRTVCSALGAIIAWL